MSYKGNGSSAAFVMSIIVIVILAAILFFVFQDDIALFSTNFNEPTTSQAQGTKTLDYTDGDNSIKVKLNYKSGISISGKAVALRAYDKANNIISASSGNYVLNVISPLDVGVVWGDLAKDNNYQKHNWVINNRVLSIPQSVTNAKLQDLVANYHLIPSTPQTKTDIEDIKVDDTIILKGYIVDVNYSINSGVSNTLKSTNTSKYLYVTKIKSR